MAIITQFNPKTPSAAIIELVGKYSKMRGIPKDVIKGIIQQESKWDPKAMRYSEENPKDRSYGLMQLTVPTGQWMADMDYGKGMIQITPEILYDPESNIRFGTLYYKYLIDKYGNTSDAVSAFNAGKPIKSASTGQYINLTYVSNVLSFAARNKNYFLIFGLIIGLVLYSLSKKR